MMAEVMKGERVRPRNVSMYDQDWAVVNQVAKDMGLNVSQGLRYIVRDWQKVKRMVEAQRRRVQVARAHLSGKITDEEMVEALRLVSLVNGGEAGMVSGDGGEDHDDDGD